MCGCRMSRSRSTSRLNRARTVSSATSAGSSLTATMRSFLTNRARQTSPIPPCPIRSRSSNGQIQRFVGGVWQRFDGVRGAEGTRAARSVAYRPPPPAAGRSRTAGPPRAFAGVRGRQPASARGAAGGRRGVGVGLIPDGGEGAGDLFPTPSSCGALPPSGTSHRGGDARRLAGRHRVAGHPVAGVGEEVPGQAPAGGQQAVHVGGDEGPAAGRRTVRARTPAAPVGSSSRRLPR